MLYLKKLTRYIYNKDKITDIDKKNLNILILEIYTFMQSLLI